MSTEAAPLGAGHLSPASPREWISLDGFWGRKLALFSGTTIHDVFDKFERVGALDNFDRVVRGETDTHKGYPFFDGLVYETIRGASDFLAHNREPRLEARIDRYVDRIAAAQAALGDGYINTFVTLLHPSQRWGIR